MIFRESRVPIVIPKFLSLASSKPGTTFLSAVKACIACSLPSISAFVKSSTFVQSNLPCSKIDCLLSVNRMIDYVLHIPLNMS